MPQLSDPGPALRHTLARESVAGDLLVEAELFGVVAETFDDDREYVAAAATRADRDWPSHLPQML